MAHILVLCEFGACGGGASTFASGGGGGHPTQQIQSLWDNLAKHIGKIINDPDNQAAEHWGTEVETRARAILEKAAKVTQKRRPGSLDKYLQRIIGVSGSQLEDFLPSPIIMVNPCVTNPFAPHCNRPYNGPS